MKMIHCKRALITVLSLLLVTSISILIISLSDDGYEEVHTAFIEPIAVPLGLPRGVLETESFGEIGDRPDIPDGILGFEECECFCAHGGTVIRIGDTAGTPE